MSDSPASHYAKIYRRRLSMAERGVTSPLPIIVSQSRELLRALEAGDPNRPIRVEEVGGKMVFTESISGRKIGSLDYDAVRQNKG